MEFTVREMFLLKSALKHSVKDMEAKFEEVECYAEEPEDTQEKEVYYTVKNTLAGYEKLLGRFKDTSINI